MNKIFIVLIILILTIAAYLRFQLPKKFGMKTPAVPVETQGPVVPFKTSNLADLDEEEKILWKDFEPVMKKTKVYAGDMKVRPPCPEDTHEEKGYCRKGASKYDKAIKYIGGKILDIDASCRPDQCDIQCKKACEDASGEECTLSENIRKECLKDHPPEKPAQDEAELREQGIQCQDRHAKTYNDRYRCTYSTSEHEQFRYVRTATNEECRQMYDTYQKCRNALPPRSPLSLNSDAPNEEAEMRCTNILNDEFAPARCEVAWTEPDKRPYGKAGADEVTCNFGCL